MLFLGSLLCATVLLTSAAPLMDRLPETPLCSDGSCFVFPEACPILDCKIILKIDPQSNEFANFILSAERDSDLDDVLMLSMDNDNGAKTTFTCYPGEQRATVINEVDGQIDEIGSAQLLSSGMDMDLLQCELAGPFASSQDSAMDNYVVSLGSFNGRTASVSNEYALYPFVAEEYLPFFEGSISGASPPGLPIPMALESEQKSDMQKKDITENDTTASSVDPRDSQASVQQGQFEAAEDTTIQDVVVEKSLSPPGASTTIKDVASTAAANSNAVDVSTTTASDITSSIKSSILPKEEKKSEKVLKSEPMENVTSSANTTRLHTTTMVGATITARNTTASVAKDKNQPLMRSMDSELESDEEATQKPLKADRSNSTTEVPTKTTSERSDPDDDIVGDSGSACSVGSLLLSVVATYCLM